jgi:hypothetical protein
MLPLVRIPPAMEFSSTPVWHRPDERLCCCGPEPPARIVPGIEEIVEGFVEGFFDRVGTIRRRIYPLIVFSTNTVR